MAEQTSCKVPPLFQGFLTFGDLSECFQRKPTKKNIGSVCIAASAKWVVGNPKAAKKKVWFKKQKVPKAASRVN